MSTESIIGIVSGIFGIIAGIWLLIQFGMWLKKRYEINTLELFKTITAKETRTPERRKALRKLNKSPLVGNRIKEEYIENFSIGNLGPEGVLFDLCDKNNIEPTEELCKNLIGAKMQYLNKKYQENRMKQ